jgi:hypothetical protein
MGWVGHLACMRDRRGTRRIWWEDLRTGDYLENRDVDGRIILIWNLRNSVGRAWTHLIYIRIRGKWRAFVNTIMNLPVVVCFLLGNSSVSEFYMPMFRNTQFHLHRQKGVKNCKFYMPTFRNTLFHHHRQEGAKNYEFYMPTFRNTLFHLHRQ